MFPEKKKKKRLWLGKDWKLSGPPILSLRFYTAASGQTVVPAIEGELLCWYKMLGGSGSLQDFDLVITLFFFLLKSFFLVRCFCFGSSLIVHSLFSCLATIIYTYCQSLGA